MDDIQFNDASPRVSGGDALRLLLHARHDGGRLGRRHVLRLHRDHGSRCRARGCGQGERAPAAAPPAHARVHRRPLGAGPRLRVRQRRLCRDHRLPSLRRPRRAGGIARDRGTGLLRTPRHRLRVRIPYAVRAAPIRFHARRGAVHRLSYTAIRDEAGTVSGIFVGGYDVTEAQRSARSLAVSEDRFRRLNETLAAQVAERTAERDRAWRLSQELLVVARTDGCLEAVNDAWSRLLAGARTNSSAGRSPT